MKSVREVTKEYNEIVKAYERHKAHGVNCYVCEACRQVTKTIDIDPGTTPFMFTCTHCGGMAQSRFYRDVAPTIKPHVEWYRPSLEETLKLRKPQKEGILEHVLMGGLLDRKIVTAPHHKLKHG